MRDSWKPDPLNWRLCIAAWMVIIGFVSIVGFDQLWWWFVVWLVKTVGSSGL